jgi:O-methyltransferase domain/Dimerisation domain
MAKKQMSRPVKKRRSQPNLSPAKLLQLGMGFWGPRTLLSAVELGVFTELAKGAADCAALQQRLGLHERSARDFLDGLVALGALQRKGTRYSNTPESGAFLDRAKPSYIGGILEMAAARVYPFWASLTDALKTGQPQNESKAGDDFFGKLYADPARLRGFLSAMTGVSMGPAQALARKFPWTKYRTFLDVGGAQGCVSVQVALAHKHLSGGELDLPSVGPVFEEYVRSFGLQSRLRFHAGDFFRDAIPTADVLIMGHILHDWDLEQKLLLLQKAYAALPSNGALIVYDAMIDDARCKHVAGLMMSLNMLIETPGGFDYTAADCRGWMKSVGFRKTETAPLVGPASMVVGYK